VGFGLAALVVILFALSNEERPIGGQSHSFDGWALAMLVLALALLLWRQRLPGLVVVGVLGVSYVWYLSGYTSGIINLPILVAFYHLGATGDRRRQVGIGGLALGITPIVMLVFGDRTVSEAFDAVGYPLAALNG